jgi:4-aminobutyrate aminotransferase-like enzyme
MDSTDLTPNSSAEDTMPALFHLGMLPSVQAVVEKLEGTCLDSAWPRLTGGRSEQFGSNAMLFSGGSAPRDVWAESGLGATIDASVVATGSPLSLIDLCSMTANTILGINDPWVKLKQVAYLMSSRPHYLTARIGCDLPYRVAQRVLRCFDQFGQPGDFVVNLRQCNGSDAVELALHAAWKAASSSPARIKLATFRGSYHGESLTANWVSEHQPGTLLAEGPDNVVFSPAPQVDDAGELTEATLATLEALDRAGDSYFAVIVEPIQWRNSVHVIPFEFLSRLRDICTRRSICLVFDEMQNAFGYTGTISFAENCGVCPDISAISKALTSGHGSLAIIVAKRAYREIEGPFGAKSNSGNMLALVAVDAVLDRLLGMDPEEAEALPAWLPSGLATELRGGLLTSAYPRAVALVDDMLAELRRRFPSLIGAPRGLGLVRGLVMLEADGRPSVRLAVAAAKVCLLHGVYVRQADTAVLVKPCMVLRRAEADAALTALSRTFEEVLRIRDER